MGAKGRLVGIVFSALALVWLGTHVLAALVGIPTRVATGHKRYGPSDRPVKALISGSSLTYSAIDWASVADRLGMAIESWPVPGSSPAEWEQLQRRSPQVTTTFVGVSLYDLNEVSVCEFRANIVPIRQTLEDLRAARADVSFVRRMLNWYSLTWLRSVFPTVGMSDRVIFGLRDRGLSLLGRRNESGDTGAALQVVADEASTERVSDWPEGRLLRRLASMRANQGRPWFAGPKHQSLIRLLRRAREQGVVVVLVLPVSGPFQEGILQPADTSAYETSLSEVERAVPGVIWIRLDDISGITSAEYYSDLVHLNSYGRSIVSPEFMRRLDAREAIRVTADLRVTNQHTR